MMGTKQRTFAPQINVSLEELVPQVSLPRFRGSSTKIVLSNSDCLVRDKRGRAMNQW